MSKRKRIIKPTSIDKMFKEFAEERRKHPVRTWLRPRIWQIIRFPGDVRCAIKTFIQRGKRGYADYDVWGLCYYLSDIISKSVYHLKRNQNGMPNGLTEGQWIDILNKITYTFEIAKDIVNGDAIYIPIKEWSDAKYTRWCASIKDINKKHTEVFGMRVLTKKQSKEFEEGFKLFQEYFFDLWD